MFHYSCVDVSKNIFQACFGYDNAPFNRFKTKYLRHCNMYPYGSQNHDGYIERQTGEQFHTNYKPAVLCVVDR